MSNIFGNFGDDPKIQRHALKSRYSAARINLLLMIIFSLIKLVALITNSRLSFPFSASIPCLLVDLGMALCGLYPAEYYNDLEGMVFLDKSFFVILVVISLLVLAIYLLCWIFSKKNRVKFLTIALGLFCFDTFVMLLSYGVSSIIDVICHIWIIAILAIGISAHKKLKILPKEDSFIEGEFTELPTDECLINEASPRNNEEDF